MKKLLIVLFCVMPFGALAHAVPTSYAPAHGAALALSPPELVVAFSNRVDPASATLILHSATGTPLRLTPRGDPTDPYTLHAALPPLWGGVTIMWGVVSLDDGHYTRGAFNFSVGDAGNDDLAPGESIADEAHLAIFLFALLSVVLVLRVTSFLFLEKNPRYRTHVRSYTLLEALMSGTALVVLLLLFPMSPTPEWLMQKEEGGITITLHALRGSPDMELTVSSREDLPPPFFEITNHDASIDPMPIAITPVPSEKKTAVYRFPISVFVPYGTWHVSTTFVRGNHYDSHGSMTFAYPDDVVVMMNKSPVHSSRGWVAIVMSFLALFVVGRRVISVMKNTSAESETSARIRPSFVYGAAILAFITFVAALVAFALIITLAVS